MFIANIFFYHMYNELHILYIPLFTLFLSDHGQRDIQLPKFMPSVRQACTVT